MFSKKSLWILALIGSLLTALAIYVWISDDGRKRSFDSVLVRIDPSEITRIELFPQLVTDSVGYALVREGDRWFVSQDTLKYQADTRMVSELLEAFSNIRLVRLMSREASSWSLYCVNDSSGTRAVAYAGSRVAADIHIGALLFVDPSGAGSETHASLDPDLIHAYVRKTDEDDVYMAAGFFTYHFTRTPDNWYDRTLIAADPSRWDVVDSRGEDSLSFRLERRDGSWFDGTTVADQAQVSSYLQYLSGLRGRSALGGYPSQAPSFIQELMLISLRDRDTLRLRVVSYGPQAYFWESDQNPGRVFFEKSDSLFRCVFRLKRIR
jgi:hypothetical protein